MRFVTAFRGPWPGHLLPGLCLLLLGCQTPEPRGALPLSDAPVFSSAGTAEAPDRWWLAFEDSELDASIQRALTGNYDLAAAWQRLNAARALARRTAADRSLDLDATGGLGRSESLDSGDDQTRLALGLAASYEVDLWGRIDSLAEAEMLRARASAADYQAAAISVAAELSLTWYQLAQTRVQLQLVQSQLEINQTFLGLLEERFDAGLIRSVDLVRQQQLVEATREQAIVLRGELEELEHRLAVLEGRPPQTLGGLPEPRLGELPPQPKTGLPSTLLLNRPDVRGALLRLEAADRDLAAAVSDQYPRLNLTATLETVAERPGDLFKDWLASIAGEAVAPLLDGGERAAEVDRNQAIVRQRVAEYGQTVLVAFAEVEDALALEARRAERLESLREQRRLAEASVEQLQDQFLNGVGDYLAVLTALRDKQQLDRDFVSARYDLIATRIALYRALAGGFPTPYQQDEAETDDNQEPRVE